MPRPIVQAAAVAFLTLVGLLAPLVPAAVAADLTATQTVLTGPDQVRVGKAIVLRAAVVSDPGAPDAALVPGVPIGLQKLVSGAWVEVDRATTGTSGTVTFSRVAGSADPTYRAVFDGDETYALSASGPVHVSTAVVASTITLTGPRSVADEHSAVLHVSWRGADGAVVAGGLVNLYTRPTTRSTWKLVSTLRTGSKGTLTRTVTPRVDTLYKVRGAGGAGWKPDSSAALYVDNVPPGLPVVLPKKAPKPTVLAAQPRATAAGAHVVVSTISDALWDRMTGISWHQGCPVGRSKLRLIEVNYYAFDGYRRRGSLVVRSSKVGTFKAALEGLYAAKIPIRYLYLPDRFGYSSRSGGANDYKSMEADNSSAFNCRGVTGNKSVRSPHSYGTAFDLNTWENPYHSAKGWVPNGWWVTHSNKRYAWRSKSHQVVKIMVRAGFTWTYKNQDSQHFDA